MADIQTAPKTDLHSPIMVVQRQRFSVDAYTRMREAGILTEDHQVELLDGDIYIMSPMGSRHIALVNRLNKILVRAVQDDAIVSTQNAVRLDDYSEPQPDIALLRPQDNDYEDRLAYPDDIFFLIEISDSSSIYDRERKLPRYAMANIGEVWIVDANEQLVEQHMHPLEGQYTTIRRYIRGMTIQSLMLPQLTIAIDHIFRK